MPRQTTHPRREQRKLDAADRVLLREQLTDAEHLRILAARPGSSARETARLLKRRTA